VKGFGCRGRNVLKTDGEPANFAHKEAVMRRLLELESAPTESESNGRKRDQAHHGAHESPRVRRRKSGGRWIPELKPRLAWFVEHVSELASTYLQVAYGRIVFERLFGNKLHEGTLEFGEKVHWSTC
jgi:hypothetical protein